MSDTSSAETSVTPASGPASKEGASSQDNKNGKNGNKKEFQKDKSDSGSGKKKDSADRRTETGDNRKPYGKGSCGRREINDADSDGGPSDTAVSRSKSEPAQVGRKGAGRTGVAADYRSKGDERQGGGKGRDKERDVRDRDAGGDRANTPRSGKPNKGSEKPQSAEQGDNHKSGVKHSGGGGAEILNMLSKPSAQSRGSSRSKGRSRKDTRGPAASDLEAQWQKEEEEKKKKEEEERLKKKEEEEKARMEEEKKRQEEEERERKKQEELNTVTEYVEEMKDKAAAKEEWRSKNLNAADNRPDDSFFTKLDSSLKKNTAFVRKLRNLTESQKEALTKDFSGLNLNKYIGEAAAALTEAKLKMSDIHCALHLCSLLHQRYAEFSASFLESWQKILVSKKDEKITNLSKLRVDLRFFAELVAVGVFSMKEGLPMLASQLTLLINNDKEEHNNLSIIISFCRHCGDDYAGLLPRKYRLLAEKYNMEIPRSKLLPGERQRACRQLFKEYYSSLCTHVIKDHKDLHSMEKQNRKILQTKGELNQERLDKLEAAQQAFQKLYQNTQTFSDLLDEELPELPEEEIKSDADSMDIFNANINSEYQYEGSMTLFEDEDSRVFYENLPDLRAFIPGILYKDSEHGQADKKEENEEGGVENEDLEVEELEKEIQEEAEKLKAAEDVQAKDKKDEEVEDATQQLPDDEEDIDMASSMKMILEAFLQNLPNCVNRDLIDKAAVDFCTNLNTKANRRKLVKALFQVHRTRYDLLPFYSRLVATLHPCMPDVATDLVNMLKGDFKWHLRKKDQMNIESKLKSVRFIGEMVKFNMFPKTEALHCLKMLLFDFSHHNIEMACALLETCGRFLYRSPDSHHRTRVYLEVMMRKKAALHLDSRYTTIIENAYFYSNPLEIKQEPRKERPPMQEYIRKLLYKDLSKVTTEKVLRQMRKLKWDEPEMATYACKCLTAVWHMRYNCIHCAANVLAGLAPYHEEIAIQVVDWVLEDIRIGMEMNHPKFNQRRVSTVKYLGELYNYRMVESAVVFKTLYSFISFGVTMNESEPTLLDPAEHLFRIRLVCTLLDTCGQYFDRGSSKKKLDCFLVYFQRYYWFKRSLSIWTEQQPFPMDIEYLVKDTLESLRPKLKLFESWEEASKSAEELDEEYRAKLANILPSQETDDGGDEEESGLPPIRETDEMDDLSQGLSHLHGDESSQESELGHDGTDSRSQSQTRSLSHSQTHEGEEQVHDDDDDDGEESDMFLESAGEDEADDQVTMLAGGLKHIKCQEDEDFMAAFDRMMTDNIQSRSNETTKVPQMDIAVPIHIKGQEKKGMIDAQTNSINFVLMTKRGNKQQFTNLEVPLSEKFASKYMEREEAERVEKERMKKVVLDMHERQEEEDLQELLMGMHRPVPLNVNRERRVRYQHPKGAPDADLIFGSKKR